MVELQLDKPNMRLSKNFTLDEFLVSQTAERHSIDMTPPQEIIDNLQRLVTGCLQPLRDDILSPIFISSGWRPLQLNTLIGGSASSEHVNGNAVDFIVVRQKPFDTCELIVAMGLPFDQVILEFSLWAFEGRSRHGRPRPLVPESHSPGPIPECCYTLSGLRKESRMLETVSP